MINLESKNTRKSMINLKSTDAKMSIVNLENELSLRFLWIQESLQRKSTVHSCRGKVTCVIGRKGPSDQKRATRLMTVSIRWLVYCPTMDSLSCARARRYQRVHQLQLDIPWLCAGLRICTPNLFSPSATIFERGTEGLMLMG